MSNQVTHFPVSDVRKDIPNLLSVGLMALLASLVYEPACHHGIREIAEPQFLVGAGADNYGCYPVAESAMGAVFFGVVLLQMSMTALLNCRKKSVEDAKKSLIRDKVVIRRKPNVNYYFGLNALTLHLPRAILGASVTALAFSMPWVHVALDMGARFAYRDDTDLNAGENAAAHWGFIASRTIPVVMFAAACLLPTVKNLRYAKASKTTSGQNCVFRFFSTIQRNLFVDQTAEASIKLSSPSVQSNV